MKQASMNFNTILTAIVLAVLMWIGKSVTDMREDVAVLKVRMATMEENFKSVRTVSPTLPNPFTK